MSRKVKLPRHRATWRIALLAITVPGAAHAATPQPKVLSGGNGPVLEVAATGDYRGHAVAAWTQATADGDRAAFYATRNAHGRFGAPVRLTKVDPTIRTARDLDVIGSSSSGAAAVIWVEVGGGTESIHAAVRWAAERPFAKEEVFSSSAHLSQPSAALDGTRIDLVWIEAGGLRSATREQFQPWSVSGTRFVQGSAGVDDLANGGFLLVYAASADGTVDAAVRYYGDPDYSVVGQLDRVDSNDVSIADTVAVWSSASGVWEASDLPASRSPTQLSTEPGGDVRIGPVRFGTLVVWEGQQVEAAYIEGSSTGPTALGPISQGAGAEGSLDMARNARGLNVAVSWIPADTPNEVDVSRAAADIEQPSFGPPTPLLTSPPGARFEDTSVTFAGHRSVLLVARGQTDPGGPDRAVAAILDRERPWVASFSPDYYESDVSRRADVRVTFNEPMRRRTVKGAFSLTYRKRGKERQVGGDLSFRKHARVLIFDPTRRLPQDEELTIKVDSTATDLAGNHLRAGRASFYTRR
jgi:hypothetical protein